MMDIFGQSGPLVAGCVVLAALAFVVREVVAGTHRAVGHDLW